MDAGVGEALERARSRRDVGALGVIDEGDAGELRDPLDAVRQLYLLATED